MLQFETSQTAPSYALIRFADVDLFGISVLPGDQNCYFRAPQLCFECPQTLEQPTIATPRFDTDT